MTEDDKDICRESLGVISSVFKKNAASIAKKYGIKSSAYSLVLDDDVAEVDIDQENISAVSYMVYCYDERVNYSSSDMDNAFRTKGQTDGMTGFQELHKILKSELSHLSKNFNVDLDGDTYTADITVTYDVK